VKKSKNRDLQFNSRDLITALAVCHNVTPTYPDPEVKTVKVYQASSPDEVSLVKFAEEMGMDLIERDSSSITLRNPVGTKERFDILAIFPFSSNRKRMGIIVKHLITDKIIFYLKGAETIMKHKV